jgi:hypothetical protein
MRNMRLQTASCVLFAAAGCAGMSAPDAEARGTVQRDVEGYAIATCLADQDQPYLKDQGDGWASVIVQRGRGGLEALTVVAAAVKAELAMGDMAVIHNEEGPVKDKPLPVMYCNEIIDTPSVRAAINGAVKKLAPSYRRP